MAPSSIRKRLWRAFLIITAGLSMLAGVTVLLANGDTAGCAIFAIAALVLCLMAGERPEDDE